MTMETGSIASRDIAFQIHPFTQLRKHPAEAAGRAQEGSEGRDGAWPTCVVRATLTSSS
jgi:hypothetical protein